MADPLALSRVPSRSTAARTVVIHAAEGWLAAIREGRHAFFTRLEARLKAEGMAMHVVDADSRAARLLLSGDGVHILVGAGPAYGPGILHARPSYIWGFWYLDEVGAFCNSSIRFARFQPAGIDARKATWFFNGVSGYMLRENVSKIPQPVRLPQPLEPAAAVIFCQEIEAGRERSHYLTTGQMIRTVARHRRDRLVYVKLHPNQSRAMRREILSVCNDYPMVRVCDASVHDLVAASGVVVTQNSAAGFEALMQRRPVVTCAKSDYWHATLTAKSQGDLRDALTHAAEAMAGFPYEKYLYWFLHRQCLEPARDSFPARAWARIREKALF